VRASPKGGIVIVAVGLAMLAATAILTFQTPPANDTVSPAGKVVAANSAVSAATPSQGITSAPITAVPAASAAAATPPPLAAPAPAEIEETKLVPTTRATPVATEPTRAEAELAAAEDGEPFAQSMLPPAAGTQIHDAGGPVVIILPVQTDASGKVRNMAHARSSTAFALGRDEVTRGEYAEFVRATNRANTNCRQPGRVWSGLAHMSWRDPGYVQDDHHPVVCVSWDDATAYAQWLSRRTHHRYRLPSQAEWLLAARLQPDTGSPCRRGNVSDESSGSFLHLAKRFDCKDGFAQTAPVGRFAASSLGIHDLLGNASEWTHDCVRSTAKAEACPERVFRGMSWHDGPDSSNLQLKGAAKEDIGYTTVGFRLLREIDADEQFNAARTATR